MEAENGRLSPPPGVEFTRNGRGLRVRARAGTIGPLPTVAFLLAAVWTGKWALDLAAFIAALRAGKQQESSAALFICAVAALAGLYCAALCLWTMIGHEALAIRNGRLFLANPWLLGLKGRGLELDKLAFTCTDHCAGANAKEENCCCRWSAADYSLNLEHDGRRLPIFTDLPREAKNWLRDRLNAELDQSRAT